MASGTSQNIQQRKCDAKRNEANIISWTEHEVRNLVIVLCFTPEVPLVPSSELRRRLRSSEPDPKWNLPSRISDWP
jgi:hypothetical protein